MKSLQRFSESDSSVSEPRIFNLTYQKICEMLIKELLLTKESYIFHEFRQLFEKMIETFCPRSLYEKYTEEEKSNIEFTKFFQTGFVLDDNILSGNQYNFQRIVIK